MFFYNAFTVIKICAVLIVVLFTFSNFAFAKDLYWPVINSERGESYIDFWLQKDSSLKEESIIFEENTVKYNKQIDGKKYIKTLIEYYGLARKNKADSIVSLYYAKDGSLDRFKKDVLDIPDMFGSFHKLHRVEMGDVYLWGNYVAITMKWYGDNNKLLTKWVELLHCKDTCLLSDRLFHLNENFNFFSALMPYLNKDPTIIVNQEKRDNWVDISFDDEVSKLPVSVRHHLSLIKDYDPLIKAKSDKSQLANVTATILDSIKNLFSSNNANTPEKVNASVKKIFSFIEDVWKSGLDDEFKKNIDDHQRELIATKTNLLFKKHWNEDYKEKLIQSYSFEQPLDKVIKVKEDVLIENFKGVKSFSNMSLVQRMISWKEISPLAYANDGGIIYIWFKTYDDANLSGYYLFAYDEINGIIMSPDDKKSWRLLMNTLLSKATVKYLLNLDSKPNEN